jgi:ketosteroid isomerase-like protein
MSAATPLALITTLVEARDAGDVDTALACYDPSVVIVSPQGTELFGLAAARTALAEFTSLAAQFSVDRRRIIQTTQDVALHYSQWRLTGAGAAGPFDLTGTSTDVLVSRPGAGWLLIIDNPYGIDILTAPQSPTDQT